MLAVCVAKAHGGVGGFVPSTLGPGRDRTGAAPAVPAAVSSCPAERHRRACLRLAGHRSGEPGQDAGGSKPYRVRRRRPGAWGKAGRSSAELTPAMESMESLASVVAAEFATSEEWAGVSDDVLKYAYTPSVCRPGAAEYMRGLSTADESAVLRWIRAETRRQFSAEEASMQVLPEQGKWLSQLVIATSATKILELGSFTGYSSTCMGAAMPPEGHIFCVDVSAVYTSLAREAWQRAGLRDRISLHIGPVQEYLAHLLAPGQANEGTFDLIFINADKESYLEYCHAAMRLVRPGGAICIDQTPWSGRVVADSGFCDPETGGFCFFLLF